MTTQKDIVSTDFPRAKAIADMKRDIELAKRTQLVRNVLAAEHLHDVFDGPDQEARPLEP